MEFHISRWARDHYQFDQSLFGLNGNVIFADFHAARVFSQKMNLKRDLVSFPEKAVKAGQINAMGLVDEILHYVIALYQEEKNPQVMKLALEWVESALGESEVDRTLREFVSEFPPLSVYLKETTAEEYLSGTTGGVSNRVNALEEMLMLWVSNKNPALDPYVELFDDDQLKHTSAYRKVIRELGDFFDAQPPFGPKQQTLVDMLRSPAIAVPHSLFGQLEYIREFWAELLGRYLYRLLSSIDLIKEEEKMPFTGFGPGTIPIPVYDASAYEDVEKFSQDKDWMPRLVLIAKHTYVWLDQLSKKYQREITRLDQIPDEELDILASRGFSGLWLIGLWERSKASARIKQLCGNPEAVASAYSLWSYDIANELGGESAYNNLRHRAWQRGIRLASDMVPNHMGIDSPWVVDHPDWFISLDYSPFPSYTFSGPDLSADSRATIQLEDHYYDRTDAAVTFKYTNNYNGHTKYIYHGNDGTSMPWNDTAQLNYLDPNVREAIIQTILHVARKFPIIRFDAAMTLAKKHYQRLWFPQPGSGGDIPSRAEHALTREQFDARMPVEFWREVVDRVAAEAPDTLLLAEAFWLMEGYFVRTLGMHRVYNSAFMNLLRNEDNAEFRKVLKNTLEFDPEILKRYVNFMNNPDEKTAQEQFGDGDKYFGICTLMATMPGLPMFGHGQVEGFTEKYGMEYRRAYWEEQPNEWLIKRHEREIFPLLHRRREFSGIDNFLLFDFFTPDGYVDENVYAFSNGNNGNRNLVIYHNKYANTRGWVRNSVGFSVKEPGSGERRIIQRSLQEGLNLHADQGRYVVMRDQASRLEYIYPSKQLAEQGLYLELGAYDHRIFIDIHEVEDDAWHSYRNLCDYLNGRGVPDIQEALQELLLQPVQGPFRQIANPGYFNFLLSARVVSDKHSVSQDLLLEAQDKLNNLLDGIKNLSRLEHNQDEISRNLVRRLNHVLSFPIVEEIFPLPGAKSYLAVLDNLKQGLLMQSDPEWFALLSWVFVCELGKLSGDKNYSNQSQTWLNEWRFGKILRETCFEMGLNEQQANTILLEVNILTRHQNWLEDTRSYSPAKLLSEWLSDEYIQRYLGVNRHKGILWFRKEAYEKLIWWMSVVAVIQSITNVNASAASFVEQVLEIHAITQTLLAAEEESQYQVAKLLEAVELKSAARPL